MNDRRRSFLKRWHQKFRKVRLSGSPHDEIVKVVERWQLRPWHDLKSSHTYRRTTHWNAHSSQDIHVQKLAHHTQIPVIVPFHNRVHEDLIGTWECSTTLLLQCKSCSLKQAVDRWCRKSEIGMPNKEQFIRQPQRTTLWRHTRCTPSTNSSISYVAVWLRDEQCSGLVYTGLFPTSFKESGISSRSSFSKSSTLSPAASLF